MRGRFTESLEPLPFAVRMIKSRYTNEASIISNTNLLYRRLSNDQLEVFNKYLAAYLTSGSRDSVQFVEDGQGFDVEVAHGIPKLKGLARFIERIAVSFIWTANEFREEAEKLAQKYGANNQEPNQISATKLRTDANMVTAIYVSNSGRERKQKIQKYLDRELPLK